MIFSSCLILSNFILSGANWFKLKCNSVFQFLILFIYLYIYTSIIYIYYIYIHVYVYIYIYIYIFIYIYIYISISIYLHIYIYICIYIYIYIYIYICMYMLASQFFVFFNNKLKVIFNIWLQNMIYWVYQIHHSMLKQHIFNLFSSLFCR